MLTTSVLESASLLLRTQVSKDNFSNDEDVYKRMRQIASANAVSQRKGRPFTVHEIGSALMLCKTNSAPGLDGLTLTTTKALFEFHPKCFLFIFNSALRLAYFPSIWKSGKIIFIPKPGRTPEDTSSYRPIVMNSLFGKILERLLNSRLYSFLHNNNLIQNNQFGFTSGVSAVMALYALKQQLQSFKTSKIPALLISLDFKGAFDSVWHPLVLAFFQRHGCPQNVFYLLKSFLTDRKGDSNERISSA